MSETEKSSALFAQVQRAFEAAGWNAGEVPGREVLQSAFEGEDGKVGLHVQAFAEIGAVSVVARPGIPVGTGHRAAAAELLNRLNMELTVGGFEMDPDSGEVLFRVANLFPEAGLDTEILQGMVQTAVAEADGVIPLLGILTKTRVESLATLSTAGLIRKVRDV